MAVAKVPGVRKYLSVLTARLARKFWTEQIKNRTEDVKISPELEKPHEILIILPIMAKETKKKIFLSLENTREFQKNLTKFDKFRRSLKIFDHAANCQKSEKILNRKTSTLEKISPAPEKVWLGPGNSSSAQKNQTRSR